MGRLFNADTPRSFLARTTHPVPPLDFFVLVVAFNILLLVWVARDAKARGVDRSARYLGVGRYSKSFPGLSPINSYMMFRKQNRTRPATHDDIESI
jgi:hypothetical protein